MNVRRIAMWSPPRARSTLLMRVFEALGCSVFDEPFYAYWLRALDQRDDPGFAETLAAHDTDWRRVVAQVLGPVPEGRPWYYQKHMAIHMLPDVALDWMAHSELTHCFLIRDPREVIASMTEFRSLQSVAAAHGADAAAALVGIPQLQRIHAEVVRLGTAHPPIIDANDVLRDPEGTLGAFCKRIGLPFDPKQTLSWAPGQHSADGAWAPFWYQKVFATTRLGHYSPHQVTIPAELQGVVDACMPTYERLYAQRLRRPASAPT